MLRICLKCGDEYEGDPSSTLCRRCAEESKKSVLRIRICTVCGRSFSGGPKAMYCPDCRESKKREYAQQSRERQRQGKSRKLGGIDKCAVCGKEYIIEGSKQKYCKGCAAEAIAAIDREQALIWSRAHTDYDKRRKDREDATAAIKCAICGTLFIPGAGSPVTCSPECAKEYHRQKQTDYQKEHRAELNVRQNERNQKKIKSMTPEELAEYREKINARARENYKKRKEKENQK